MSCFYDFLSLTGLFSKVALIHNRLLEVIMVDLAPVKSAKVYTVGSLNYPDRLDILLEKRFCGVVKQGYIIFYGRSRIMFVRQVFCAIISLIFLLCSCSVRTDSDKSHLGDCILISSVGEIPGDQVKVLIIDGVNNHDWEMTTKATLEATGRFKVDVSTSPRKRASKEAWEACRPKFSDYQVVLSNFNDDCEKEDGCDTLWSAETQADFLKFVREGGGFVPVHAADNAFGNWPEYNKIIGIGGWGGRKAGKSGSLLRLIDGKWQTTGSLAPRRRQPGSCLP